MRKTREPAGLMPRIPGWDEDYYGKAEHRATSMTETDMYGWIEAAFSGMYKSMADYRKDGQLEHLEEMLEGLTAVYALLAQLRARREQRQR